MLRRQSSHCGQASVGVMADEGSFPASAWTAAAASTAASQQEPSGTAPSSGFQPMAATQAGAAGTPTQAFDPAALAALYSAASTGMVPPFPSPAQLGPPGWPTPQPRAPGSWPQSGTQPSPTSPPTTPSAQSPAQVAAFAAAAAAMSQASGADPAAQGRMHAALSLMAHQWASQMAMAHQQYAALGWPPGAGATPWSDPGAASWPGWGDASTWPPAAPTPGEDALTHIAAAAAAAAGAAATGYPGAPSGAAVSPAALDLSSAFGQDAPADANSYALEVLEQMKGEASKLQAEGDGEAEPLSNASDVAPELDEEGQALREDISSAVAQFLAGDDGFNSDSDAGEEMEPPTAMDASPSASSAALELASTPPPAQSEAQAPGAPCPPPREAPPPPQGQPQAPPPAARGPPSHLASAALAAAGLMPTPAPFGQTNPPAEQPPASAEQVNGPTPEGVQDFLNVLRRRALPAEVTEEKRKSISTVICSCVTSLYRDRIRPVQSNVQRRLRERTCSDAVVQALLPICAREPETYRIQPPMGNRLPVILLAKEPRWFEGFVDTEAPEGTYSPEAWEALTTFLSDDHVSLPSNPYQAAMDLRQLNLPHLQNLALGEIEHMVRLSMGKRRLLTFHGDNLKPARAVRHMDAREKLARLKAEAEEAKISRGTKGNSAAIKGDVAHPYQEGEITDRDDLAVVLLQLMQRFPDGVSLSLMKQHVQSHCKRSLNEAAFKCSKLAEVFKLSPLSSIFPLEQVPNRNEIIVRPPKMNAVPSHIWQKFYVLKEHGGLPPHSLTGPPPTAYVASGRGAAANATAQPPGSGPAKGAKVPGPSGIVPREAATPPSEKAGA